MSDPCELSAVEARSLIGDGILSPVELFDACRKRIEEINPAVNAIVAERFDEARLEAQAAETAVTKGEPLKLLHGLPIGVKDANEVAGLRSTYGSLIYKDNIPTEDEGLIKAVRANGAVVMGKTNTPEFTAGANTVNLVYGATCNPFDTDLTCGGSSGGTAVALATGMLPLSMGSDIGGSVRLPATFCGVVGHRPTPGLVPYDRRAVALTPLDLQGPLARNVKDTALLLSAMAMPGGRDPMAFPHDFESLRTVDPVDLPSVRVGMSSDLGCAPIANSLREVFEMRMKTLASHVSKLEERDPDLATSPDVFWILRGVYFAAAHKKHYEEHYDELGDIVRSNYESAVKMTMEQVGWACAEQMRICQEFDRYFEDFDVLICPGVGVPPFPHIQNYPTEVDGAPMENYLGWVGLTSSLSPTGHPVTAIPMGVGPTGMPFGIQVVGPKYGDRFTLSVAAALEELFAAQPTMARPIPDLAKLRSK